jgi:hypothetical protein
MNIEIVWPHWEISRIPEMVSGECFSHPFHKLGSLQMGDAFDLNLKVRI